jgi:hypothetical protein
MTYAPYEIGIQSSLVTKRNNMAIIRTFGEIVAV